MGFSVCYSLTHSLSLYFCFCPQHFDSIFEKVFSKWLFISCLEGEEGTDRKFSVSSSWCLLSPFSLHSPNHIPLSLSRLPSLARISRQIISFCKNILWLKAGQSRVRMNERNRTKNISRSITFKNLLTDCIHMKLREKKERSRRLLQEKKREAEGYDEME